ncbi:MAG: hypothetical protein HQL71_10660 [Magnetococcales bacterium]|nr:hypothetical protein [Magnetococcales bacterium]
MESTGIERSEALLVQLEGRMDALTNLVVTLRNENAALGKSLADSEEKLSVLTQQNSALTAQNAVLLAEKEKTVLKIETLLARFNHYEQ